MRSEQPKCIPAVWAGVKQNRYLLVGYSRREEIVFFIATLKWNNIPFTSFLEELPVKQGPKKRMVLGVDDNATCPKIAPLEQR